MGWLYLLFTRSVASSLRLRTADCSSLIHQRWEVDVGDVNDTHPAAL